MISSPTRREGTARAAARFPVSSDSPRQARAFVAEHLHHWHCDRADDVALLLVSELVTNAVFHAKTTTEVEVACFDRTVRVAVSDGVIAGIGTDTGRRPCRAGAPTGRGLCIVDGLADRWGVTRHHDGKTVWFEVRFEAGPAQGRLRC